MLLVSVMLHVGLALIRFSPSVAEIRKLQQTYFDVVLVNQKSIQEPDQTQALAQANLNGGGDAEDNRRASTPMAYSAEVETGTADMNSEQRITYLDLQQRLLLAQVKTQLAVVDERIHQADTPDNPGTALFERRRLLAKQLGQIERFLEEQNKGPRRRYISPSTREVVFADYYDRLKQRVEKYGTENFPTYEGARMYGNVVMALTINAKGELQEAKVMETSGNKRLDKYTAAIARAAQPYMPFDPALRKKADELVVVATFRFTRAGTLQTQMQANPDSNEP